MEKFYKFKNSFKRLNAQIPVTKKESFQFQESPATTNLIDVRYP